MLIYLHGFNSSPGSHKTLLLKRYLEQRGLAAKYACPALPHWPDQAIAAIESEMVRAESEMRGEAITFVGSSLGGFYATHLAEKHFTKAVLINPAVHPHTGLRPLLGPQQNLYTGERYELTEQHFAQWERLFVPKVTPERYLLLVESGDEVLDYREAVEKYRGARQIVVEGGDHTLQSFPRHIPLILAFAGLAPA